MSTSIAPDDPELTRLLSALHAGDAQAVSDLLTRRPALAATHSPDGATPLHVAAECDDPRLGLFLLSCGADPQARYGQSGHTAMSWAVTCNALSFARMLTRLAVKPDLFCAAGLGLLDEVMAFFDESGALLAGASRTGSSRMSPEGDRLPCPPTAERELVSDALYIASRNAHADVVRYLLTRQPDLTFRAYLGGRALHWAHFGGSREVIDLLLQAAADPNATDNDLHCTPRVFGICAAASWGLGFLVRARLAGDSSLATLMDGHTSALHEAARHGHAEVVRLLLEAGADPRQPDGQGRRPLELAVSGGHAAVAELFQPAPAAAPPLAHCVQTI